jgi:L-threonylcarbamoyladenylate synthase
VSPVDQALDILRSGGLVAIPTETVYGLAADASNPSAVARIFAAKGRPTNHPLIVHIADADLLDQWAADVPKVAQRLTSACWPGPLTVLVRRSSRVLDDVTGGRHTVGVRVPAHPLTTELLHRFGGGLAAPSANRFGRVSPTTAQHVRDELGDLVDYVLDGGPSEVGVESTIVDCTVDPPQLLRPGGIPVEQIEALLAAPLDEGRGPSRAAGMLVAHYQPHTPVVLVDTDDDATRLAEQHRVVVIRPGDNLVEAARVLYSQLREADRSGVDYIVAVLPAPVGLGHAIIDRLRKAAGAGYANDRP